MSRRAHKLDAALTASMGYADKRSYRTVHTPPREYLFGADKSKRRLEIYERDKGICQHCGKAVPWSVGEWSHEPPLSHSALRESGDDSLAGGKWSCVRCHDIYENRFPKWTPRIAEAR